MVSLQRRLAAHREREGFAPTVRIGIHAAEATRSGTDYVGTGVSQAARIGAAAGASEVLVSRATADGAPPVVPDQGGAHARAQGIAAPTEVVSVDW